MNRKIHFNSKKFFGLLIIMIVLMSSVMPEAFATVISMEEYISLHGKTKEYYNLTITTRDNEEVEKLLPNAKYAIKQIIARGELEREANQIDGDIIEIDPHDFYGNLIGKEEVINGEICRTFTSDENGEIKLNLWEGKYKITQVDTEEGYNLNEENTYIVNVEKSRGAIEDIKIEDPVIVPYWVESVSTNYVVEGRNDGCALYYYSDIYSGGKLSLLNNDNVIVSTFDIGNSRVNKIVAVENGWYVLIETEYYEDIYIYELMRMSDKNGILEVDDYFEIFGGTYVPEEIIEEIPEEELQRFIFLPGYYKSFDIDNNGNIVFLADYNNCSQEDEEITNSSDIQIVVIDPVKKEVLEKKVFGGDGEDYSNTILVTDDAYYLTTYFNSKSIIIDDEVINLDTPYCIFKMSKDDLSIENVQILPTYAEASDQDEFRRIHTIKSNKDGSLYYIGSFKDVITFDSSLTSSGEKITLHSKGEEDGIVIKLNKDLLIEWVVDIGGEGNDHFYDAGVTEDGGIVIGGDSDYGNIWFVPADTQSKEGICTETYYGNASQWRGVTVKLNEYGEVVWAYEFGYTANEGMYGVAVLSNDTFALCGFESPNGSTVGIATFLRLTEYKIDDAKEEPTKLNVTNERKELKIVTSTSENGNISGQYDDVYETVKYLDNTTKPIIITPDKGYKIKYIKINGQTIEFTPNEDNSYTIENFESVKEDKNIEVEFEIDPSQTKELKYTVEYYKDDIKQEDDIEIFTKEIQILDETTKTLKVK